ncbi:hypothetical protein [Burkholderia sp. F1]|uniref:hypothetical protein n=1 Tax=Burkholderia sp. F1 TaxID=3366817 RepID=UPI003D7268E5
MVALVLDSHALPATSASAVVSASGKTRINVRRAFACAGCGEIEMAASGCRCAADGAFMIPRNMDMRDVHGRLRLVFAVLDRRRPACGAGKHGSRQCYEFAPEISSSFARALL